VFQEFQSRLRHAYLWFCRLVLSFGGKFVTHNFVAVWSKIKFVRVLWLAHLASNTCCVYWYKGSCYIWVCIKDGEECFKKISTAAGVWTLSRPDSA
jgi:hypothetical protein